MSGFVWLRGAGVNGQLLATASVGSTLAAAQALDPRFPLALHIVGLVGAVVGFWLVTCRVRPRGLYVDDDRLILRFMWRRVSMPWADVSTFEPVRSSTRIAIDLVRTDGSRVRVPAIDAQRRMDVPGRGVIAQPLDYLREMVSERRELDEAIRA